MVHYLIEFRFQGKAKKKIKSLMWEIDKRCKVGRAKKKRPIPHITLVGPFTTNNEKRLICDFANLCSNYPLMKFGIKGFNTFKNSRVIYIDIKPTEKLDEFRWGLSRRLSKYCKLKPLDHNKKFFFHATLAMRLTHQKFKQVKQYVQKKSKPNYNHLMVRATLLKGGKILREYDFLQRKLLTRRQAKSRSLSRRTKYLLNQFFHGTFNPNKNIRPVIKQKTLWQRIKTFVGI